MAHGKWDTDTFSNSANYGNVLGTSNAEGLMIGVIHEIGLTQMALLLQNIIHSMEQLEKLKCSIIV